MRTLFELDQKDYHPDAPVRTRPSARAIIIKDGNDSIFIQDNYYFLCDVDAHVERQNLDDYEADEGFTFGFVDPKTAIDCNRKTIATISEFRKPMLEREARVLELLLSEGYFKPCPNT